MFTIIRKEIEWCGRKLSLETGRIARQADGAVLATYGETVVLCTVVAKKEAKEGIDFFPLTANYQEKAFAAGKIPGGFFKREGRPSEKETLVSRLIDRPIRPLFPEGFHNEVQIICTVLSHDGENDPDIVAMVGASAALTISGVPFQGPIGAIRVGYQNGEYVFNPPLDHLEQGGLLDLVVAGTEQSVLMVESEAKGLSEEVMLGAVEQGHRAMQPVIQLIKEFKSGAGKPDWQISLPDHSTLASRIKALAGESVRQAYAEQNKQQRVAKIDAAKTGVLTALKEELGEAYNEMIASGLFKKLEKDIVRNDILDHHKRIDGRGERDIRNIIGEVQVLPRTHGSALFTRGETQALAVVTLGTGQDVQIVDALVGEYKESFMLHYNFPPYSVGEAGMLKSPGRREIGHGKLAWRALKAVIPPQDQFPYTLRIVSEITESNGSSSMATVCGSSLAMMDAGVPITSPVAGIAMGLIKEGDRFSVLSDILGDEDHLGDMDFKVAGTAEGVTALQMDIKINGITTKIMEQALHQAKEGRKHILGKMNEAIHSTRSELSQSAPRIHSIYINKEKIGEVIGPGGKVIREICEKTGVKIDINDDGKVNVAATDGESAAAALAMIQAIVQEVESGKIYQGKVTKIFDFGILVEFLGKTEGLVHISEIKNERIENVQSLFSGGESVKVKVIGFDRGKPRLSMKRVNQDTGEDLSDQFEDSGERPARRGGDRDRHSGGGRDRDRGGRGSYRGGDRDRHDRGHDRDRGGERNERRGDRHERHDHDHHGSRDAQPEMAAPSNTDTPEEKPRKKRRFF